MLQPTAASDVVSDDRPTLLPLPPEEPLDLALCFTSGQLFRWRLAGETWHGPFGQSALALTPCPGGVRVAVAGPPVPLAAVARFLGLDHSLPEIERRLARDAPLRAAFAALPGLRVLRQDPWDALLGYLCSQWSNIPKIERTTERLARAWGTVRAFRTPGGEVEVACLPPPEALARLSAADLRATGAGYRAAYLPAAAARVAAGEPDLEALRRVPYEKALAALLTLPGVGRKVADCVLLFGLGHLEAFPVDLWVRRVMWERYRRPLARLLPDAAERRERELTAPEYRALARFARRRWGTLAGYAQEYLFVARRAGVL